METITDKIVEMRLIVEGAIALYERKPDSASDDYSLIGEALYLMREKVDDSLKVFKNGAGKV